MTGADTSKDQTDAQPERYGYTLGLLTVIYVFNFVDRQVMTIVAEPIKRELGLADWQVGAMTGLSFALLYCFLGFPIARIAERGDRAKIIALAVVVWSFFTVLCGLARNFPQLLLARVGVGVGEAGCTPPAHSLIADIAPRAKLASALAIYAMGAPIGQLFGVAIGGIAADTWGWRSAFLIAGAPGLALALLAFLTLREPRRGAPRMAATPSAIGAFRPLLRKKTFWLLALGASGTAFTFYGHGAFAGSFFLRNHGPALEHASAALDLQPIGFLGIAIGLTSGAAGVLGAIIGGRLADMWARRDTAGLVLLPSLCSALSIPFLGAAMLTPSLFAAIALSATAAMLNAAWFGPVYATLMGLVQPHSRATASATLLFTVNLIGLGLGPLFVGLASDGLTQMLGLNSGEALRWALIAATGTSLFSATLFWCARGTIRNDTVS